MKKPVFKFDFKTRHAGISTLITIAVLAGIILINLLAEEVDLKADLTPKKLYSLTDDTVELLDGLQQPVEIIALYRPGSEPETLMEAVNEYTRKSRMVTISVIDPDRNPAVLAMYSEGEETVARGSFIVTSGSEFRVIPGMDMYDLSTGPQGQPQVLGQKVEQQVSSAIAYVTTGITPVIYEITGHGESPLAGIGYAGVLEQANYTLEEISLIQSNIPDDAALLTLIGARADLNAAEADKLDVYLSEGGSLLVALDYTPESMENLYGLLRKWDIEVKQGIVLETEQNRLPADYSGNPFIFAPYQADHEALASLAENRLDPVFQATMGFAPTQARQRQLVYEPILQSSPDSRLRTDLNSDISGEAGIIPGDEAGPIDVAIGLRQRNTDDYNFDGGTIVALGTASTLQGLPYIGQIKANADMVMLLVNWTVGEEATVAIESKSLYRLPLRIGNLTGIMYAALTIIFIPLACIIGAMVVYFRRRHK